MTYTVLEIEAIVDECTSLGELKKLCGILDQYKESWPLIDLWAIRVITGRRHQELDYNL